MKIIISEIIKEQRRRLGVSQEALADQFGVSIQAVSKWENGLSCPDITLLPMIAEYFGVTIDYLLTGRTLASTAETDSDGEAEAPPAAVYTVAGDSEIIEKCPLPDMLYLVQVYNGHIITSSDNSDEMIDLRIPNGVYNISLHTAASLGDIRGSISINEGANVGINGNIKGNVTVNGNSEVGFNADIYGDVSLLNGEFHVNDVSGDVSVTGGSLDLEGDVGGDISASSGQINIVGDINGDVTITDGNLNTSGEINGDVDVKGTLASDGDINGDISQSEGNIIVNADLTINGSVESTISVLSGNLTVEGDVNGNISTEGGNATVEGDVNGNITTENANVTVEGDADGAINVSGGNLAVEGDLTSNNIRVESGDVSVKGDFDGSIAVVSGNVSVEGDVGGNIAVNTGDFTCGCDINGKVVVSNGDLTAETITDNVTVTGGNVTADDIEGSVQAINGNVTADDIEGDVKVYDGKINCDDYNGDVTDFSVSNWIPEMPEVPEIKIPEFPEVRIPEVPSIPDYPKFDTSHFPPLNYHIENDVTKAIQTVSVNGRYIVYILNTMFLPSAYTHLIEFPGENINIRLEMDYDDSKAEIHMLGVVDYELVINRTLRDISGNNLTFNKTDGEVIFYHTGGEDCVFTIEW